MLIHAFLFRSSTCRGFFFMLILTPDSWTPRRLTNITTATVDKSINGAAIHITERCYMQHQLEISQTPVPGLFAHVSDCNELKYKQSLALPQVHHSVLLTIFLLALVQEAV